MSNSGFINRISSVTKSSANKFFHHNFIFRTISEFFHLKTSNKTNPPDTSLFPLTKIITYPSCFQAIFTAKYEGFIYLTNGWLQHLTTAFRYGEARVQLHGDVVHITTDIEFNNLIVSYLTPDMNSKQLRGFNLTVTQAYRRLFRLREPSLNYRNP
jgi:hypothetical protein